MKSTAKRCLEFSGLFEAELLVRLMLKNWNHPLAQNEEFADALLEGTAEALQASVRGEQLLDGIPPTSMNFVSAAWYVEHSALEMDPNAYGMVEERTAWLSAIRHSLPSC